MKGQKMSPEMIEFMQDLINKFYIVKYNLESAAHAFRGADLKGFGSMASHEGGERWDYAQKIIRYCEEHDMPVEFRALPAAVADWKDPTASIGVLISHDKMLLDTLEKGITMADRTTSGFLIKIYDCMNGEYQELTGILAGMRMAMNDYIVDKFLETEYGEKKGCCQSHGIYEKMGLTK